MPKQRTCDCGECRTCKHREYMRGYLRANPEKNNASGWHERNAAHVRAKAAERRRLVPKVVKRAQDAVAKAIKRGELVRPEHCARCRKPCKPVAHHHDYTKPLDIEWLCRSCHAREHSELP